MSIFLMLLSFVSGLGVLISFVTGLISYFSDSDYKKWWQGSLILFAVMSVLTLLAAVFDSESGLSVAFGILWIYVSLLMFAFILVYIIKRIRRDEIKGYKKRIGITFITGFILFFIVAATGNGPENVEREMNEAAATVEEELEEERKALDAEKEEIAAERRKLEKEKSIEQEKKEKEEQSAEEKSIEIKKKDDEATAEKEFKEEPKEEKTFDPVSEDRIPVTVASFTDGDTTRFIYNGNDEPFRYLLIDTPETKHPRLGEQPFGKEASARTKELLSNADVIEVEFDIGAKQDHYQRNLAYVYVDGKMLNEILVREGLAQVNYVEPPNTRYLERLETAQALAQQENIGIWSLPHPFDSEIYQEEPTSDSEENNSSSKSSTSSSDGTEYFQNCTELKKVYPDGVPSGHAAYQPKMDRDKDDYACE